MLMLCQFFAGGININHIIVSLQFMDGQDKLDVINNDVRSRIANRCGCVYMSENVFGSEFTCSNLLPPTAVVYRSNVRGFNGTGCDDLSGFLRDSIETNPSLLVLGNRLDFIPECDTSVDSVDAVFECNLPTTPTESSSSPTTRPTESSSEISIAVIAGAAGGGAFVLVILVVCVVLLVCFRRNQRKKRM